MTVEPTSALRAVPASARLLAVGVPLVPTVLAWVHRGTSPHDIRIQAHEKAAQPAPAESQRLLEKPGAQSKGETVRPSAPCRTPALASDAQRARAEQQRLDDAHRKAAAQLRAEADATFDSARRLRGPHNSKRSLQTALGRTALLRPVPGLAVHHLQRLVSCHLAPSALPGHVSTADPIARVRRPEPAWGWSIVQVQLEGMHASIQRSLSERRPPPET